MLNQYIDFVESKKKSGHDILTSLTPQRASIAHMLAGLQDEMMEVDMACDKLDEENLREELGDLLFYTVGLASDYGLTLSPQSEGNSRAFEHVVTAVKRDIYYQKPIDLEQLNRDLNELVHFIQEVGEQVGRTLQQLIEENQNKLNKRYTGGYSDQQAQQRADKQ